MRFFPVFLLTVLFAFPAMAGMTPEALQKKLSGGLPAAVADGTTPTVTQKGADWVIAYPPLNTPQQDGSVWRIGASTVTLHNPTGSGAADATIVLAPKSELVTAAGTVAKVVTLTGQDLKGTWSFDRNALTGMNGTVRTVQWRDEVKSALNEVRHVQISVKARFKDVALADLDFDIKAFDGRAVPMTLAGGFLPKTLAVTGRVVDLPVESLHLGLGMLPTGALQPLFARSGTGVGIRDFSLSALNGVTVAGEGALKAEQGSARGMVAKFNTVWHGLDPMFRDTQAKMFQPGIPPQDRAAATQTLFGLMVLQGVGIRQPDDTHVLTVDLLADGRTLLNGKDMPDLTAMGRGGGTLPGLPNMLNPVRNTPAEKNSVDFGR